MKIGIALSGCDAGGLCAFHVLRLLEEKGFTIEMVSCCGISSVTALLYGVGDVDRAERIGSDFWKRMRTENLDNAIEAASEQLPSSLLRENDRLAVSAVNVEDGKVIAFTNAFSLDSERLCTLPLTDAYDTLSATVSPLDGLTSYRLDSMRLCDYSVWYGCPLYPLKMSGISRTVSISFLPERPETPYTVMTGKNVGTTAAAADIHIPILFPSSLSTRDEQIDFAANKIKSCINLMTWNIFYPARKQ